MSKGRADPKCPDCKGEGEIQLFSSCVECDCVQKSLITAEGIAEASRVFEKFKAKGFYDEFKPFDLTQRPFTIPKKYPP